jgi:hypothetical protein
MFLYLSNNLLLIFHIVKYVFYMFFLQLELPFKVTSYLLLLEYVVCSISLFLMENSTVTISNGHLNEGQLSTTTNFDVNEYRNCYVNFPIIAQSCNVPVKTESQIRDQIINIWNVTQY